MFALVTALSDESDEVAGRAFDELLPSVRRVIRNYLELKVEPELADDVLQDIAKRLWQYRHRLTFRGNGAWWRLLFVMTDNCLRSRFSISAHKLVRMSEDTEIPDRDLPALSEIISLADDIEMAYQLADELWLGKDPRIDGEAWPALVLLGQLLLVDRLPWLQARHILSPSSGRLLPGRDELDQLLVCEPALRRIAYNQLYVPTYRLIAQVVGLPAETPNRKLEALMTAALAEHPELPNPDGWSWPEIAVAVYRLRYGMSIDQIVQKDRLHRSKPEILKVLSRVRGDYPHAGIVERMVADPELGTAFGRALACPGVWMRIAFQYAYCDCLPHQDIHAVLAPAAERIGYSISTAMLNGWISQGRLIANLAKYVAQERASQAK